MREIKFRAWNDDKESMYSWSSMLCEDLNNYFDISTNDDGNSVILMQYTGLKDKNGVEIYEGDIVASSSMPNSPIEYQRGAFNGIYDDGSHDEWEAPLWRYTVEVIGNIYENPELLEATL